MMEITTRRDHPTTRWAVFRGARGWRRAGRRHGPNSSKETGRPFHAAASMRKGMLGACANVPVQALRSSKLNGGISCEAVSVQRDGSRPAASNSLVHCILGVGGWAGAAASSNCGGTPRNRTRRPCGSRSRLTIPETFTGGSLGIGWPYGSRVSR